MTDRHKIPATPRPLLSDISEFHSKPRANPSCRNAEPATATMPYMLRAELSCMPQRVLHR